MQNRILSRSSPRITFLLVLCIGISLLFFWMIKGFLMAILLAAVMAGITHPFCRRFAEKIGGRKGVAAGVTVLLCLVLVIVPLLFFIGLMVNEAVNISGSATEFVTREMADTESLDETIEKYPELKKLVPYQDEIITKAGELAARAGSHVAGWLAAGAAGTASFVLALFIMLFAMFQFLINGPEILETMLRHTPLSGEDRSRLLGTFASVGRATLKGTVIIGIVQGSLAGLSFWVAGIEGVIFWSTIMAVLSIIPGIGAALIWVPAVVYLFLNGQTGAAIGVALWCAIVVGTVDNFLRPVLIGKDTEMPDLLVLLTTLGGLAMFGATGILIGPIIGALFMTAWRLWGGAVDEACT